MAYGTTQLAESMVNCVCNNLGAITNVISLQTMSSMRPNDTINNDQDVYFAICIELNGCTPLKVNFLQHVGQQDKDTKCKLMTIEQFKIDCD